MLVEDMLEGHRCLCLREVQNSIKDSDKQIVEDKIAKLGLQKLFRITDHEIIGPKDSLMIFRGLQNHTTASIKSMENFTRAFVDEAQTISKRSLDLLTPTIRAPGSQLWFGWNPEKASDPVDRMFRENAADPGFVQVEVNYYDNPWFSDELRQDMERDKRRDPEKYAHVWLGGYQRSSEARVFHNWKVEEFETPADVRRFYLGADWGWIDPTVLVRCYISGRTLFVDHEAWQTRCDLDKAPVLFDKIPGSRKWPITADSSNPQSIAYMRKCGFNITHSVKGPGSIDEGIEFLKTYDIVVHPRCTHVIDELASYSYEVDKQTDEVLPVLADDKNHTIDSLRYAIESVRRSTIGNFAPPIIVTQPRGLPE